MLAHSASQPSLSLGARQSSQSTPFVARHGIGGGRYDPAQSDPTRGMRSRRMAASTSVVGVAPRPLQLGHDDRLYRRGPSPTPRAAAMVRRAACELVGAAARAAGSARWPRARNRAALAAHAAQRIARTLPPHEATTRESASSSTMPRAARRRPRGSCARCARSRRIRRQRGDA